MPRTNTAQQGWNDARESMRNYLENANAIAVTVQIPGDAISRVSALEHIEQMRTLANAKPGGYGKKTVAKSDK